MFFDQLFQPQSTPVTVACVILLIVFGIYYLTRQMGKRRRNAAVKRAGNAGESIAKAVIKQALKSGDHHLCNIVINYEGKEAEMDDVVVNNHGVFIIEVKNYKGKLYGTEDDYEWEKVKTTDAGNDYEKTVRNPVKQVDRQVYIMAKYLKEHDLDVWVEGYAYFVEHNAPFKSERILETPKDIDRVLHYGTNNSLTAGQVEKIKNLLS